MIGYSGVTWQDVIGSPFYGDTWTMNMTVLRMNYMLKDGTLLAMMMMDTAYIQMDFFGNVVGTVVGTVFGTVVGNDWRMGKRRRTRS